MVIILSCQKELIVMINFIDLESIGKRIKILDSDWQIHVSCYNPSKKIILPKVILPLIKQIFFMGFCKFIDNRFRTMVIS